MTLQLSAQVPWYPMLCGICWHCGSKTEPTRPGQAQDVSRVYLSLAVRLRLARVVEQPATLTAVLELIHIDHYEVGEIEYEVK
jgi:hypothetical protein